MMAQTARLLPHYTYDDYVQWEGRWELIEGIPFAMSPMAHPKHQRIASRMNYIFEELLEKTPCACNVYHPIDVKISATTIVQPDLLIVCAPINKNFLDFAPNLVVEILSPSTRQKDLFTKFELYQNFGVKYYIIVDPEDDSVIAYQLDKDGTYQKMLEPFTFSLTDDCQITPDFSSL